MGYSLIIGELETEYDAEDEYIRLSARGESHPDAPAFGEPTDGTNSRWPSYTTWADFTREAGLEELFYGSGWDRGARQYTSCSDSFHRERPLLNEHPGAAPITRADADFVEAALAAYLAKNPDAKPGFPMDMMGDPIPDAEKLSPTLGRLQWLAYWMRWAVDNCKHPVLANS